MYRTAKYVVAAVFAVVLFAGAVQAADDLFMPYNNSQSPDGSDQSVGVYPESGRVSREQALEWAMPETDSTAARDYILEQPSRAHGSGVVSDRSLAMPYRDGMNDGRDQSVLGD